MSHSLPIKLRNMKRKAKVASTGRWHPRKEAISSVVLLCPKPWLSDFWGLEVYLKMFCLWDQLGSKTSSLATIGMERWLGGWNACCTRRRAKSPEPTRSEGRQHTPIIPVPVLKDRKWRQRDMETESWDLSSSFPDLHWSTPQQEDPAWNGDREDWHARLSSEGYMFMVPCVLTARNSFLCKKSRHQAQA